MKHNKISNTTNEKTAPGLHFFNSFYKSGDTMLADEEGEKDQNTCGLSATVACLFEGCVLDEFIDDDIEV